MSAIEDLDLVEFEDEDVAGPKKAPRRRSDTPNYRKKLMGIPIDRGMQYVIVPEVSPLIRGLVDLCARECPPESHVNGHPGITVLAARAALILGTTEENTKRRLHNVVNNKQLFINAHFIEGCLMAMDVEHEYRDRYGEWPSCRADALERVSLEAEYAGKKVSPSKLLARANKLYEKGLRKALKHAPEVAT